MSSPPPKIFTRLLPGGTFQPNSPARFAETKAPCDLDFAYFAFTIGMCYQVSDVTVASVRARRAVLLHSIISFTYNTMILALALNIVTYRLG